MSLACGIFAVTLASAHAAPAATGPAAVSPAQQLNYRCLLAPEPQLCAKVYQKASHDSAPASWSLREAYKRYARYLVGNDALTDADKQYLKANQLDLPNDLTPLQTSGLHNAINDPSLATDRKSDVTNYLLRAEQANIYCGLQPCNPRPS